MQSSQRTRGWHSLQQWHFTFWCAKEHSLNLEKDKGQIFQQFESDLADKRVKLKKYEALNKALKKWLILHSENIPLNGFQLKEKALELANELNIESFQTLEGCLKKWKKIFHALQTWYVLTYLYNSILSFSFERIYFSSTN